MNADHIRDRLHSAMHRSPKALSNSELEEVTTVTLEVLAALAAEVALVVAELGARVQALEAAAVKAES